ncbi:hypothetical protein LUZ60_003198 [Juncus effusus]|nr:hypothetical protein LUZ60_003198 [Juncus effusus]
MPFGPYVGVNQHGQSILLGCCLLPDETTETFVWVMKTWLTCMGGRAPRGIITDQCAAMANAIQQVLPNTHHLLCLWHIMQKIPQKVGQGVGRKARISRVKHVVYNSYSTSEFEEKWQLIIDEFPIGGLRREWRQLYNATYSRANGKLATMVDMCSCRKEISNLLDSGLDNLLSKIKVKYDELGADDSEEESSALPQGVLDPKCTMSVGRPRNLRSKNPAEVAAGKWPYTAPKKAPRNPPVKRARAMPAAPRKANPLSNVDLMRRFHEASNSGPP